MARPAPDQPSRKKKEKGAGRSSPPVYAGVGQPTSQVDHVSLRLWLRLLTCHNLVETRLRQHMRTSFETTLPRFDLMAQLDRHPEGLKMRDLSRLLMVTGGNITGLIDRLVAEGLIERREDPADRRAYYACLTEEGRRQFQEMAGQHEAWVISLLSELSEDEQQQLSQLLGKLKGRLAERLHPPVER